MNSHNDFKRTCFVLPLLLKSFYSINRKKLFLTLFKKSRLYYKGVYKILYVKQLGLCYICDQPLNNFDVKIKVFNYSSSMAFYMKYVFLIHNYCCFF